MLRCPVWSPASCLLLLFCMFSLSVAQFLSDESLSTLASAWRLRIVNPVASSWIDTSLLSVGFEGTVPQGTDLQTLQVCVSVDGGGPSCMGYQHVWMTGLSEGAHSVVACWLIPGFGSCFDHAYTVRQILDEKVPGRDQVSFVVVHPFQHSAVQWVSSLGNPLPYSV